jgi:hypothetical protein
VPSIVVAPLVVLVGSGLEVELVLVVGPLVVVVGEGLVGAAVVVNIHSHSQSLIISKPVVAGLSFQYCSVKTLSADICL